MNKRLAQLVGVVIVLAVAFACAQATAAPKNKEKKDHPRKESKEAELPAAAKGFAGMIHGKVLAKTDGGGVVLTVEEVTKVWKHSKAEEPKSLVGKGVVVVPPGEGKHNENIVRFLKMVKVEDEITVDVANKKGGLLTLLELTKEQREKIEKE